MDNYDYNMVNKDNSLNNSNLNSLLAKIHDSYNSLANLKSDMDKLFLGIDALSKEKDDTDIFLDNEFNRHKQDLIGKIKTVQDSYRKQNEFQRKSTSKLQHELIILKKEKNELQQRITDTIRQINELEVAIGIDSLK